MKKNYTSPAIEMEIIAVEQGIAISGEAEMFGFATDGSATFDDSDDTVIW